MDTELIELARQHQRFLDPIPTHVEPQLPRLREVRAAVFDIYGTLLISGSGDVGSSGNALQQHEAAEEAFTAMDVVPPPSGTDVIQRLHHEVHRAHAASRDRGIESPEVDIVGIWQAVVGKLHQDGRLPHESLDPRRLAMEYELRANPVAMMPGAVEVLERLRTANFALGIVSNAQFFTPLVWAATFGRTMAEMGIPDDMQYFSYRYSRAKPSTFLYQLARQRLTEQRIAPEQVLYIGNDMRNDIWGAAAVGFRTALFAGDQRSLRWRSDDDRLEGLRPECVATDLKQLLEILDVN